MSYNRMQFGKNEPSKKKLATALGYDHAVDIAPRVLASGQRKVAERIIELARENNIPIQEDPFLASALSTLDVGENIPPELYAVVAEVLVYVYRIQNRRV